MKILKKIIEYILVFILSIVILGFLAVNLISSTILKKDYVLSQLEKTEYYDEMYKIVEENFENYIGPSGFEEEVFEGIVTKDIIKEDTKKIIDNIYEGSNNEIDVNSLKETLNSNIESHLKSTGRKQISETQKKAIEQFIDNISNEYKSSILNSKYEAKINNIYVKIVKYKDIAYKVLIASIICLVIILALLNIKSICSFFVETGVAVLTSSLFLIITYIFINKKININHIVLFNDAFEKVLRTILQEILSAIKMYGIIMLASSLAIIILFNLIQNMKKTIAKNES